MCHRQLHRCSSEQQDQWRAQRERSRALGWRRDPQLWQPWVSGYRRGEKTNTTNTLMLHLWAHRMESTQAFIHLTVREVNAGCAISFVYSPSVKLSLCSTLSLLISVKRVGPQWHVQVQWGEVWSLVYIWQQPINIHVSIICFLLEHVPFQAHFPAYTDRNVHVLLKTKR